MANKIQLRRDSAANWQSTNPTLAQGEVGIDLTSNKIKIGNGTTAWNGLPYFDDKETVFTTVNSSVIPSTDNAYDLGSPTKQWRHAYISEGSLYIGNIKLTNENGVNGYVWSSKLNMSIQSKDAKNTMKEIINMIKNNNYTLQISIELETKEIVNFKIN
jgi:hypothetical protein